MFQATWGPNYPYTPYNTDSLSMFLPSEARNPQAAERGLTGNLKTMFTILHDAGASGLSHP